MSYNGHKNWNHWNVSLWINNDEYLYREAYELQRKVGKDKAAMILAAEYDGMLTPDGAPYTKTSIRAAMVGM